MIINKCETVLLSLSEQEWKRLRVYLHAAIEYFKGEANRLSAEDGPEDVYTCNEYRARVREIEQMLATTPDSLDGVKDWKGVSGWFEDRPTMQQRPQKPPKEADDILRRVFYEGIG